MFATLIVYQCRREKMSINFQILCTLIKKKQNVDVGAIRVSDPPKKKKKSEAPDHYRVVTSGLSQPKKQPADDFFFSYFQKQQPASQTTVHSLASQPQPGDLFFGWLNVERKAAIQLQKPFFSSFFFPLSFDFLAKASSKTQKAASSRFFQLFLEAAATVASQPKNGWL